MAAAHPTLLPPLRSVLCVRRGAMGDTLLLLPLLRALRARHPEAVLRFAGVSEHAALLQALGAVDAFTSSETLELSRLGGDPAAQHPWLHSGLVLGDAEELCALRGSGDQRVTVFDPRPHWGAMAMALQHLRMLGIDDDDAWHRPWLQPPARRGAYVLAPGSGSRAKCAPRELWFALATSLHAAGSRSAVLVGPVEQERDDPRQWSWPVPVEFVVEPGPSLLVEVLHRAAGLACNDSGPMHLAAAVGTRTVAWFGPTDPVLWLPVVDRARRAGVSAVRSSEHPTPAAAARAMLAQLQREG